MAIIRIAGYNFKWRELFENSTSRLEQALRSSDIAGIYCRNCAKLVPAYKTTGSHDATLEPHGTMPDQLSMLFDFMTALWLGFIGTCVGSFLNVVAYRMPLGLSIVWKPSFCPQCQHPIRMRDNVPVLGWLILRGRCRDCGGPISPRYAIVEFVMGMVFFILAYVELFSGGANLPGGPLTELTGAVDVVWNAQWPVILAYAYHCTLLSLLMCVVLCNRDGEATPKSLVWFGLVLAAAAVLLFPEMHPTWSTPGTPSPLGDRVLGALLGYALGSMAGGLAYRANIPCAIFTDINLCRGSCLVGAFLGWYAIFSLSGLILFVAAVRLRNKSSCNPSAVDALYWLAFLQITTWGLVSWAILP